MSILDAILKRIFDVFCSIFGLVFLFPLIVFSVVIASFDTRSFGLFRQQRIGQHGKLFTVYKVKTMASCNRDVSTVTASNDSRITRSGAIMRKLKIDELPQLFNVILGDMSFVGPRPDVPGYADTLVGSDREILELKPGITGMATVAFKFEEDLLYESSKPEEFNKIVIFPIKVDLNKKYLLEYSLLLDFRLILRTVFGSALSHRSIVEPFLSCNECKLYLDKLDD